MVAISIVIGFLIGFAEIFTRYPRKNINDMACFSIFLFVILNGFLASLAYYLIPIIYDSFDQDYGNITRAIFAGLGYAVILKSKIITIKSNNHDYSLGPAYLYDSFSNYFLKNIERSISEKDWRFASQLAHEFPRIETYAMAVNTVWLWKRININNTSEEQEIKRLKVLRNQILSLSNESKKKSEIDDRLIQAALMMISHFGGRAKAKSLLAIFTL